MGVTKLKKKNENQTHREGKKNQTKTPEVDCLVNDAEIFHR